MTQAQISSRNLSPAANSVWRALAQRGGEAQATRLVIDTNLEEARLRLALRDLIKAGIVERLGKHTAIRHRLIVWPPGIADPNRRKPCLRCRRVFNSTGPKNWLCTQCRQFADTHSSAMA